MKRLVLFFVLAIALVACTTKQTPVDDLQALATELTEHSENYTASDWQRVAEEYARIESELNENEYSDEELKEIGRLKGKCMKAIVNASAKLLKKKSHEFQQQLEGASEELDGILDGFEDVFNE